MLVVPACPPNFNQKAHVTLDFWTGVGAEPLIWDSISGRIPVKDWFSEGSSRFGGKFCEKSAEEVY